MLAPWKKSYDKPRQHINRNLNRSYGIEVKVEYDRFSGKSLDKEHIEKHIKTPYFFQISEIILLWLKLSHVAMLELGIKLLCITL